METPAFVCDAFSVQLSTRGLDTSDDAVDASEHVPAVEAGRQTEEQRRRQSMRSLQAAMGRISAVSSRSGSSATTRVDFVVSCRTVTQHVNMSLLRLAHQFATMIENIAKTRSELRGEGELTSLLKTELAVPAGGWTRFDMRHSIAKPPHSTALSDVPEFNGIAGEVASPAITEERTIVDEIRENTPKCWRTLYHLLDLYSTMPDMKTISRSQLSVIEEEDSGSHMNADKVQRNTNTSSVVAKGSDEVFLTALAVRARSTRTKKSFAVGKFTQSKS